MLFLTRRLHVFLNLIAVRTVSLHVRYAIVGKHRCKSVPIQPEPSQVLPHCCRLLSGGDRGDELPGVLAEAELPEVQERDEGVVALGRPLRQAREEVEHEAVPMLALTSFLIGAYASSQIWIHSAKLVRRGQMLSTLRLFSWNRKRRTSSFFISLDSNELRWKMNQKLAPS